jgi:hypothetical protein
MKVNRELNNAIRDCRMATVMFETLLNCIPNTGSWS